MVKQASGVVMAAPPAARDTRDTRRARVYAALLDAIRNGALPPGTRLPSSRQLALEWGFARGAVDEAFAQLQMEALIERRVGDGSYVAAGAATVAPASAAGKPVVRPLSRSAQQVLERFSAYLGKPAQTELPHRILSEQALFPRAPTTAQFPLATWRRLIARAHGDGYRDHLGYGPAAGLPRLREAIARHLALTRSTMVGAHQVIVVNSALHALELIARVLLESGDKVWVEDPGQPGIVSLLRVLRMQVIGAPMDDEGLNVEGGKAIAPDAAAVYFHPITQFPLGVRTTAARRAELLQWAEQSGAWIIEGNFNDEIVHDSRLPVALQNMDASDRVLMMGTLEGIMYPSLRVAYVVVPERLVDVFTAMRGLLGDSTNAGLQLALAWFIDEGHLNAHLRKLRQAVREHRDALRESSAKHLPPWARVGPLDSGTHACVHLPAHVPDREVVRQLRGVGVLTVALSSCCVGAVPSNGLVIGYGAFDAASIERALTAIGEVLRRVAAAPKPATHQAAGENK